MISATNLVIIILQCTWGSCSLGPPVREAGNIVSSEEHKFKPSDYSSRSRQDTMKLSQSPWGHVGIMLESPFDHYLISNGNYPPHSSGNPESSAHHSTSAYFDGYIPHLHSLGYSYINPQSHLFAQGQSSNSAQAHSNEFKDQDHPDHMHGPDGSSLVGLTHPANLEEAWNQNKQKIETFDVSEIPSLPYYCMSLIIYPLRPHGKLDKAVIKITAQAIHQSFQKLSIDHLGSNDHWNSLRDLLYKLCLRNLAFLRNIQHASEDLYRIEMTHMLNWLYRVLYQSDVPTVQRYSASSENSDPSGEIESLIRKTVNEHRERKEEESYVKFKNRNKKSGTMIVSEFEASEERLMLNILGNYYKSRNPNKWKSIFPLDLNFLKFYLRFSAARLNRETQTRMFVNRRRFQAPNFLPWSNPFSKSELKLKYTLFENPKPLSEALKNHLFFDNHGDTKKIWLELLEYENHQAKNHSV